MIDIELIADGASRLSGFRAGTDKIIDLLHQLGHVDKWRSQMRIEVMSMKPRKLSAVLS